MDDTTPEGAREMPGRLKNLGYFLRLGYRLSPAWWLLNLLLSFLRGIIPLAFIFAVKLFLDFAGEATQAGVANYGKLIAYSLGVIFPLFFMRVLQEVWSPYATEKLAAKVRNEVFARLHEKSVALKIGLFEDSHYKDLFHRVSRETAFRPAQLVMNLGALAQSTLALLIVAGVLLYFLPMAMLLLFAAFVPVLVVQIRFARLRYRLSRQQTQKERKAAYYSRVLTEGVFAKELRLFNLGALFKQRFEKLSEEKDDEKLRLMKKTARKETWLQLIGVGMITGLIAFIAMQAIESEMSVSHMVFLILAIHRAVMFFQTFRQSAVRLTEDLNYLQDYMRFQNLSEAETAADEAPFAEPGQAPSISFAHVSFTYPGSNQPALKDVSFSITAGETVILAGANGSGKSTIVYLLARFYEPDAGHIFMEGKDIREWPLQSLRARLGVLFQQYILYNETLRDNIGFGDTSRLGDDAQIRQASVFAGVNEVAAQLPQGYDTLLGTLFSHSRELSVGEWQKIAIARTIFRNAPIAVFDEPNSALDGKAEAYFFQQVDAFIRDKTALLILHRLTEFHTQHRILVLENGKLAEDGWFEALLQKNGALWRLYGTRSP